MVLVPVVATALLVATAGTAASQDGSTAREPVTWGIQPASATGPGTRPAFEYDVAPGDVIDDAVRLTNHGDAELTLDVYPADAFNTGTGGFDVLAAGETPVGVGAWTQLARRTVTIPARGEVDVPFTVTVPLNAEPGDHAGGIVAARSSSALDASGDPIRVDHRVGARIYARVAGELRPALVVDALRTRFAGTAGPSGRGRLTVDYAVSNTGNVRLAAGQTVTVEGPLGLALEEVVLDDLPELLPGGSYEGTVTLDGVWPALRLRTRLELVPTAPVAAGELDVVRAGDDTWAIPWIALLALAVLAGVVTLAIRRRRSGATP